MRSFEGYKRRAVILILNEEEHAKRQKQLEETEGGKDVPESALLEMKGITLDTVVVSFPIRVALSFFL